MRHVLVLLLLLCATPALAATISGTAYTSELQVARYSLLHINTTPQQRLILDEGTYSIIVPQGTYTMRVTYTSNNRLYDDELTVTVNDEGKYTYDFILFPAETNGTQTLPSVEEIVIPEQKDSAPNIGWVPAVVLLILLVAGALFLARRRWWKPAAEQAAASTATDEQAVLPADLESVIAVLKSEGGRTTQKELRKHIPCSEAKMSMMLTELEHKGRIERIKKGRGNLIVLK